MRNPRANRSCMRAAALSAAGLLALPRSPAFATSIWDGPATGNWSTATNWSPDAVPVSNDVVFLMFAASGTQTVNMDFTYPAANGISALVLNGTAGANTVLSQTSTASLLSVNQDETIAQLGQGTYMLAAGTNAVGRDLILSALNGSTSTYNMSGGTLTIAGVERIGMASTGHFIQTGGQHTAKYVHVSENGNTGTFELDKGSFTVNGDEHVGFNGTGTFTQKGGTHTVNGDNVFSNAGLIIASSAAATGTYNLQDGTLSVTNSMSVGRDGTGTFTHGGGSVTVGGSLHVGQNAGSTGTYTIPGLFSQNPGMLNVTGPAYIGYAGNGNFTQDRGQFTASSLNLGAIGNGTNAGGNGNFTLKGGTVTVANTYVGGTADGAGGVGALTLSSNGQFPAIFNAGNLVIYPRNGPNGGTVIVNGAAPNAQLNASSLALGDWSRLQITRGKFNLTGGAASASGNLTVSSSGAYSGTFTQSGTATAVYANQVILGPGDNDGNYSLQGGTLHSNLTQVGQDGFVGSTFTQSGGAHTTTTLNIVTGSGLGFYNLSGGSLSTTQTHLRGNSGSEFHQTGGTHTTSLLNLDGNNGQALYTLSGGQLTAGEIDVNDNNSPFGQAKFTHSGGSAHVNDTNGLRVYGGGVYALSGSGTLQVDFPTSVGVTTPGTFNQSGGAATLGGGLVIGGSNGAGTYTLSGGTLNGPSVDLGNGTNSTFALSGTGQLNTANFNVHAKGTLTMSGGTASGTINNDGSFTLTGGAVTGTLDNRALVTANGPAAVDTVFNALNGTMTISGALTASTTINSGAIRVLSGGQAVFQQGLAGKQGDTQVQAGGSLLTNLIRQHSLTIAGTPGQPATYGQVVIRSKAEGGATSVVSSLLIPSDVDGHLLGRMDLADNALIIDYSTSSPINFVRTAIVSGYAGGSWTGPAGILSSAAALDHSKALAYAEAIDIGSPPTFGGQNIDDSAVLVRYTLVGDATLDGRVDFNDLVKLAQNYNSGGGEKLWSQGDFNYDGMVDFQDLVMLAQNYNSALASAAIPGAATGFEGDLAGAFGAAVATPEPSVLAVVGLAMPIFRRGRRKSGATSAD